MPKLVVRFLCGAAFESNVGNLISYLFMAEVLKLEVSLGLPSPVRAGANSWRVTAKQ